MNPHPPAHVTSRPIVLPARAHTMGGGLAVRSVDFSAAAGLGLPVCLVDDFQVGGHAFGPHPHAGFSAVTAVFEDSPGGLRSRDSLGNDLQVGPGGIVWTQAGLGVLHEELPATAGRALHGLQVFVDLPAPLVLAPPQVMHLDGPGVPQWHGPEGDRVRVLAGRYRTVRSPLQTAQGFDWLDVDLRSRLALELPRGHGLLVLARRGRLGLRGGTGAVEVPEAHAVALRGDGAPVQLEARGPAQAVVLAGAAIDEPRVGRGPFRLPDAAQLDAAVRRYQAGGMGRLEPLA